MLSNCQITKMKTCFLIRKTQSNFKLTNSTCIWSLCFLSEYSARCWRGFQNFGSCLRIDRRASKYLLPEECIAFNFEKWTFFSAFSSKYHIIEMMLSDIKVNTVEFMHLIFWLYERYQYSLFTSLIGKT